MTTEIVSVVYEVGTELLRDRNRADATVARAKKILGVQPTIELIAFAGSDVMLSSMRIAGRVGIPDGGAPPLPALVTGGWLGN